jgi:hypothetical protein
MSDHDLTFVVHGTGDREIDVIQGVYAILRSLDPATRLRVFAYVTARLTEDGTDG